MPTRTISSSTAGPITVDATLLGFGGTVNVRAVAGCERAHITLRTASKTGPAAKAVREATLHDHFDGNLAVDVQGDGHTRTGGSGVNQVASGNSGSVIQVGGNFIGGTRQLSSPIEITAIVPEGSSVTSHTESADIVLEGDIYDVNAQLRSGDFSADRAHNVRVDSETGVLHIGQTYRVIATSQSGVITISDFSGSLLPSHLRTKTGRIHVHATGGGSIRVFSLSGNIRVTATDSAVADGLKVDASSVCGEVSTPTGTPEGN